MPNEKRDTKLRQKLREKIKQKQTGRMSNTQRQQEVDNFYKKLGVSEDEMKALQELTENFKKQNKNNVP